MINPSCPINQTAIWAQLHQHQRSTRFLHMRDLFRQQPDRFAQMHEQLNGLLLDYSKNRITEDTLALLIELANIADVRGWTDKMRRGDKINVSENRAVLHTALRLPPHAELYVDDHNIVPDIHRELERAYHFAESVRNGEYTGAGNERIMDIINIGIGGSHLGPEMVTLALRPFQQTGLNIHYVANVDGANLIQVLNKVNPATTIFIIASKSFTTPETLLNAQTARNWFLQQGMSEADISRHFIAITSAVHKAQTFGITSDHTFSMFDWVGGRYSVWSTIGLSVICAIGKENFQDFLAGGRAMDEHFFHAPLRHNIPVLLGLIGLWYHTFYTTTSHAIIPYDHGLRRLAAHLQQLDMESNGKQVSRYGERLDFDTGPIIWGEEGVNCQHAFFQLLHQGPRLISSDFIVPVNSFYHVSTQHKVLVANAFAQTEALMRGKTLAEAYAELIHLDNKSRDIMAPQKVFPGNQPSNTLLIDEINPFNLGMLLAMYEHKVFVQGVIWGINSFDQWGVEYGKVLAKNIEPELSTNDSLHHDASTNGLIDYFRKHHHDTNLN
ncbi:MULTISPECIES: glucose-6-phosphate isomerase [Snodgrassella]|uniref:glucose-6-phosphate isomerase n=1 Tax=Snodgrassella TaxID=1193515 RepID=UPI000A064363|nr:MULTISPECIES: glucose-6-phosphate isomerase [Snodgrassella]MBI0130291.1 glucose-6-phosphate isomerase [Snodgrassella sp. W8124]ORF28727.1 glucose-6-phosphate isomerase [Snodgrassella alvi]